MASSAFSHAVPSARDFSDINITPLVDVMLVLLIIFMVSAPALTKSVDFTLPGVSDVRPAPPPTEITLRIDANNEIAWNGAVQPWSALQGLLSVEAQRDPAHPPLVKIDASGDADYGVVTRVLAAAREANLEHIAFVQH